jgi:hypothetical protein
MTRKFTEMYRWQEEQRRARAAERAAREAAAKAEKERLRKEAWTAEQARRSEAGEEAISFEEFEAEAKRKEKEVEEVVEVRSNRTRGVRKNYAEDDREYWKSLDVQLKYTAQSIREVPRNLFFMVVLTVVSTWRNAPTP